jgi:hypothetical protein
MFTVLIIGAIIAILVIALARPKPPGSAPSPSFPANPFSAATPAPPNRRMQLLSDRLQNVEDERLFSDTLDDLIASRPKPPARTAPIAI